MRKSYICPLEAQLRLLYELLHHAEQSTGTDMKAYGTLPLASPTHSIKIRTCQLLSGII
jgi:hypothetical protein